MITPTGIDLADTREANDWQAAKADHEVWETLRLEVIQENLRLQDPE